MNEEKMSRETRDRWREPDGFAKAADAEKPKSDRSWEDRLRDSILITNTGKHPITLMGLDGVGRQVAPGDSVEYRREGEEEPVGMLTGGPAEIPNFKSMGTCDFDAHSPLFITLAIGFYTQIDYQPPPFPAQKAICTEMMQLGLIKEDPVAGARVMHYVPVHEALKVYVDALCRVPLPVKRWVMP